MTRKNYDTAEGIADQIKTLDGLRAWIRERYQAGYDRKENLNSFVVLGRWVTDTCGNVGSIIEMEPALIFNKTVVHFDDVTNLLKARISWDGMGPNLPDVGAVCPICKKGWTLDNADNHFVARATAGNKSYHKPCYKLYAASEAMKEFDTIFKEAGFECFFMKPCPNGYWRADDPRPDIGPWFKVDTVIGEIEIGWRKRVISITWPRQTKPDEFGCYEVTRQIHEELFADENVTKDHDMIHAYGSKKAIEYLRKLREALS